MGTSTRSASRSPPPSYGPTHQQSPSPPSSPTPPPMPPLPGKKAPLPSPPSTYPTPPPPIPKHLIPPINQKPPSSKSTQMALKHNQPPCFRRRLVLIIIHWPLSRLRRPPIPVASDILVQLPRARSRAARAELQMLEGLEGRAREHVDVQGFKEDEAPTPDAGYAGRGMWR